MTTLRRRPRPTRSLRTAIARHPIAAFLTITFGSTWAMTGLLSVSLLFGLVALFGPTVGAALMRRPPSRIATWSLTRWTSSRIWVE